MNAVDTNILVYARDPRDATVLAACVEGGIERLYTEDFDAYPAVEGVEIINPFKKKSTG